MNLKKIVQGYELSEKFYHIIGEFEKNKMMYGKLKEDSNYFKFENLIEYMIKNHKSEMIFGSLGYFIRHPKNMINSQKYYNKKFGKPCPLKK